MEAIHSGPLRLENPKKTLAYARIAINIVDMLGALRRLLGFQVRIGMSGADLVVSYLGSIVSWPLLLFADVCMT
jgi:hypothetical protein